eukprot:3150461-Amphidinium_carterae.1
MSEPKVHRGFLVLDRVVADLVFCSSAISMLEKSHLWEQALLEFQNMTMLPNVTACTAAMNACAKGAFPQHRDRNWEGRKLKSLVG